MDKGKESDLINASAHGSVSGKLRNLFGPEKPFLINRYLKTEMCIRLKPLV